MFMLLLMASAIFTPAFAYAGLEQISLDKANLDYVSPRGAGEVEKISLGLSLVPGPYAVELEKRDSSYVLFTPMADITWGNPGPFLLSMQSFFLKNLNLQAGEKNHFLNAEKITLKPDSQGEFQLLNLQGMCQGVSTKETLQGRLLEDCRESMQVEMARLEVPENFLLVNIIKSFPTDPRILEQPLKDFYLSNSKGDVYLYFLARYYVTAGLRAWAKLTYENNFKTVVLRVNMIKFGILPVTSQVFKALKESNKDPRIQIDSPFIRIKLAE